MKSDIEIGPLYHRLPERIQAHAALCFMALLLYRVMRMRLKAANVAFSPERALEILRQIQYHQIWLDTDQPLTGISTITSRPIAWAVSRRCPRTSNGKQAAMNKTASAPIALASYN